MAGDALLDGISVVLSVLSGGPGPLRDWICIWLFVVRLNHFIKGAVCGGLYFYF